MLVFDLTEGMLQAGQTRFEGREDLQWICGNAEALPFEDRYSYPKLYPLTLTSIST